jgi:hypothetical protein
MAATSAVAGPFLPGRSRLALPTSFSPPSSSVLSLPAPPLRARASAAAAAAAATSIPAPPLPPLQTFYLAPRLRIWEEGEAPPFPFRPYNGNNGPAVTGTGLA